MPPRRSLAPTASQIASTRIMPSPQPGPQPLRASAAAVTGHSTCTHLLPTSHTMRAWPPPACIATGIAAATNLTGCPATSTSPPRRLRRPASQLPALHPTRLRVRLQRHPAARSRIQNRQTLPNLFRAVLASAAHPHPPKASASQGHHPHARWVRRTLTTEGRTGDQQDAYAVAAWLRDADADGRLSKALKPGLTDYEQAMAGVEGWILGLW